MPKLREKLMVEDDAFRAKAAEQMLDHHPGDAEAQAALVDLIRKHSEKEPEAIVALGKAGLAAGAAIPAVLSALDGTNVESWVKVPCALTNMGAPVGMFITKLESKLGFDIEDYGILLEVIKQTMVFDPANRNAQLALIRLLKSNDTSQVCAAINILVRTKPLIPEVLPALQAARKSSEPEVRKAAVSALKSLKNRGAAESSPR